MELPVSKSARRLARVLELIDAANAEDPRKEECEGKMMPRELLYGRRMSASLRRLEPKASAPLQIAARAQHLRRWEHPRGGFPEGRAGYLRWRTGLYRFHAEQAATLMRAVGYDETDVARVGELLQKKLILKDDEAATLEDVACLVFIEHYLDDFARTKEADKMVGIIRKTWEKMTPRGQAAARKIALPPEAQALVARALSDG